MNKTPLSCILCTALAASLLLGTAPAFASSFLLDAEEGVHPHDLPGRTVKRGTRRTTDGTSREALYDFYYYSPHRSQTHALHPFNRYRYWAENPLVFVTGSRQGRSLTAEAYEYDEREGRWVRASSQASALRTGACSNYVRVRANQRTPAFGYRCIDGDAVYRHGEDIRK